VGVISCFIVFVLESVNYSALFYNISVVKKLTAERKGECVLTEMWLRNSQQREKESVLTEL
jgi:hypothetical protein